ncbi:MAG TPA: transcriptional regulator, partial [Oceanospirillales bacterium]|nr:transcriptional regulator [Oceanospirillales bacterium]
MSQMETLAQQPFYLGNWLVTPQKNQLQNSGMVKTIQPKLMEVLTFLCQHQNKIISSDDLIVQCWPRQYISDNPIHKCIAQLRKALGDSSKNPKYISTIPKKGYAIIAKVSKIQDQNKAIDPFWIEHSPFVGLKQYTSEEQKIFFGRDKVVAEILAIVDQIGKHSAALIMILGQSGCGKSSLIQAGILPKLIKPYKPFNNNYIESYTYIPQSDNAPDQALLGYLHQHELLSH